jgi:hypothetical protein
VETISLGRECGRCRWHQQVGHSNRVCWKGSCNIRVEVRLGIWGGSHGTIIEMCADAIKVMMVSDRNGNVGL